MTKHSQKVGTTRINFDDERGIASIVIKDQDMFPNGFYFEFPKSNGYTQKISQHFTGIPITDDSAWVEMANAAYEGFAARFYADTEKQPPADRNRATMKQAPNLVLGYDADGNLISHGTHDVDISADGDAHYYPKNLMIYGDPGTGKTTLLDFLSRQQAFIRPQLANFAFFDLNRSIAEVKLAFHEEIELLPLLEATAMLHTMEGPTVVFVDNLDVTEGVAVVIGDAMESLIRSRAGNGLSFIVTKRQVSPLERRFYDSCIRTGPTLGAGRDGDRGVYVRELEGGSAQGVRFRTPSKKVMFEHTPNA